MSNQPKATAIIADDEEPMRDMLRKRLHEAWPELEIVAEAANGIEAIALAGQHQPDIVFLDIRMPGLTGIEAARMLFNRCHIVFITAYDQYAIEAFEQGALDYLLKPVNLERLKTACERLQARLGKTPNNIERQLSQLLQQSGRGPASGAGPAQPEFLHWIQAQVGNSLRMISTREVLFFRADEKYTRVQTAQGEFLIRKTLKELEDELDPNEFWRIHRSTLVRVDAIAEVTRDLRGRQMVRVRNSTEELEVSRGNTHLFQQM
ncbi:MULTISPECIES: LytTR family DNA-binding domain-containing protein [unclassified Duganella]|uniref:LytR/AlgR family response regulator transcription factor n=1 Tax=unclassified Duganella TaxID=2636909 RepID=UPI0006FCEF79|nr:MULTISPECIES: LytTR family DNA-binding domain-containing protein [unclassified Duganella]KQV51209.1 two-component system response regulator [Duganella sp. Root336D2]KRC03003.1 two-component system response regulator [Duganella sp. Root198D2]